MAQSSTVQERERDLQRLMTFVDAIVAIAGTLLVLPLVELANSRALDEGVSELLWENQGEFWAFLVSFLVIAQMWLVQHRILSPVERQSPHIVGLLLAWTLTIVLLPFPTSLLADSGDEALAKILYMGLLAVSTAILAVLAWVIRRDPSVRSEGEPSDPVDSFIPSLIFVVALVISLLWPAASYFPLLLLFLGDPIGSALRRLRRGADTVQAPVGDGH